MKVKDILCPITEAFAFKGTITNNEYIVRIIIGFLYVVFGTIATLIVQEWANTVFDDGPEAATIVLFSLFISYFFPFLLSISASVRRLRAVGDSVWWSVVIILFVPAGIVGMCIYLINKSEKDILE